MFQIFNLQKEQLIIESPTVNGLVPMHHLEYQLNHPQYSNGHQQRMPVLLVPYDERKDMPCYTNWEYKKLDNDTWTLNTIKAMCNKYYLLCMTLMLVYFKVISCKFDIILMSLMEEIKFVGILYSWLMKDIQCSHNYNNFIICVLNGKFTINRFSYK